MGTKMEKDIILPQGIHLQRKTLILNICHYQEGKMNINIEMEIQKENMMNQNILGSTMNQSILQSMKNQSILQSMMIQSILQSMMIQNILGSMMNQSILESHLESGIILINHYLNPNHLNLNKSISHYQEKVKTLSLNCKNQRMMRKTYN